MSELFAPTLEQTLGRPFEEVALKEMFRQLPPSSYIFPIKAAGVVYAPQAELRSAGLHENDTLPTQLMADGVLEASSQESLELPLRGLRVSGVGAICRLTVEVGDVPTEEYPQAGQLAGERLAVSQVTGMPTQLKLLGELDEITHSVVIAQFPKAMKRALYKEAMAINARQIGQAWVELGPLGTVSAPHSYLSNPNKIRS